MSEDGEKPKKARKGLEDRGGLGLLGLSGGLIGALVISYYTVAPALLGDKSIGSQTVAAIVTLVLMIVLGGVGYYFTRKPVGAQAAESG